MAARWLSAGADTFTSISSRSTAGMRDEVGDLEHVDQLVELLCSSELEGALITLPPPS